MKAIPIISLMLLALAKSVAQEPQSYSQEFKDALRYGAKAKVTIKVVDDTGKPVKNADVKVFFRMTSGSTEGNHLIGVSDATGMFMAKSRTTDTVFISVEKDEYYMSVAKHGFQSLNPERLKDGCWLPWNPTVPVVLKKIRTPVPMILSYEHMHIPQLEKAMGLDLEKGDWVAPDGKGVIPDMIIAFELIDETSPFYKLIVEFPGEMNGAYVRKKDSYSILKSDYNASTNMIYESRIENNDGNRGPAHVLLGGNDYLVFRIRSKVDKDGNLISALYGKIYGPFDYFVASRFSMRLITFLNPVENDTNLEFDGKGFGDGSLFGR